MCTSFAVYNKNPIYGMNMDHPDKERNFKITSFKCNSKCKDKLNCQKCILENNIITRFHCQNRENNRFIDSVCMNSLGIFSNYQFLVPGNKIDIKKSKNSISAGNLFSQTQMYMKDVKDIINRIQNKNVFFNQFGQFSLHNLYADKYGNAVVLEASVKGNEITAIKDNYIVMTNFPVYKFAGKHYSEVVGDGDDRYKIANREIIKHRGNFDIKQAFDVLEKTKHTSKNYPTNCSMVFDPVNLNIYIVLFGNFSKIWKVSINEKIIQTHEGFDNHHEFKIGSKGILASELGKYYT